MAAKVYRKHLKSNDDRQRGDGSAGGSADALRVKEI
jgi:hypothetical protein